MQASILLVVDVNAVLRGGDINDHSYLVDNITALPGEPRDPRSKLTRVRASVDVCGTPREEAVLNWIVLNVSGKSSSLPRNYGAIHSRNSINRSGNNINRPIFDAEGQPINIPVESPETGHNGLASTVRENDQNEAAAYVPVEVCDIGGPAVCEHTMYPGLYGSPPIVGASGWYWSASVDMRKAGVFDYYLEAVLYRPARKETEWSLKPEKHRINARLEVMPILSFNGFSRTCATSTLPVWPT